MQSKEQVALPEDTAEPDPSRRAAASSAKQKPLLMVDIDGVLSLFGVSDERRSAEGSLHSIEGMLHFLSSTAATHLLELGSLFEVVWASGWEERANEHLPHLLGLPPGLPFLRFPRNVGRSNAHWKLESINAFAAGRPLAWIDDALNSACHSWARRRSAPTLLVQTEPELGLIAREAELLREWALALRSEH